MAEKSPIQKLEEAVVETVSGVVADPRGSAAKAIGQLRGAVSLGLTVAGVVANQVAERLAGSPSPERTGRPDLRVAEPPAPDTTPATGVGDVDEVHDGAGAPAPTPSDVARAVAKKAPPKKAATSSPSAKLPPRKTTAKKAPAKKAPAKKAPAKKAPAKKAPVEESPAKATTTKKAPAKKAPAKKAPAKEAPAKTVRPAEADPQQPGTEPLMDPATTKAVAAEAAIGARAADPDKG